MADISAAKLPLSTGCEKPQKMLCGIKSSPSVLMQNIAMRNNALFLFKVTDFGLICYTAVATGTHAIFEVEKSQYHD